MRLKKGKVQLFVSLSSLIAVLVVLSWNHNWSQDPSFPIAEHFVTNPQSETGASSARNYSIDAAITGGAIEDSQSRFRRTKRASGTSTQRVDGIALKEGDATEMESDNSVLSRANQDLTQLDNKGVPDWQERSYLYSDEAFFNAIHVTSPNLERFLSHRAYMMGHQIEPEEAKAIADFDAEFAFMMGMHSVCPECAKGLIFYEKNIAGHLMTIDEYEGVFNQSNFNQMIDASNADDYVVSLFKE